MAEIFPGKQKVATDPGKGHTTGSLRNPPRPSLGMEPQLTDGVDSVSLGLPESYGKSHPEGIVGNIVVLSPLR